MAADHDTDDLLNQLRRLAASDPKRARAVVGDVLKGDRAALESVLRGASRPGDGRLRQVVATVYRTDPTSAVLVPWLEQWLGGEPDEFTKTAIATALVVHRSSFDVCGSVS